MGEFSSGQVLIWDRKDGKTEQVTFITYEMGVCVVQDGSGTMHMVPDSELKDPEKLKIEQLEAQYTSDLSRFMVTAVDDNGKLVRILRTLGNVATFVYLSDPELVEYKCSLNDLHFGCKEEDAPKEESPEVEEYGTPFSTPDDIAFMQKVMDACLVDTEHMFITKCRGIEFLSMHKKKKQWYYVVFSREGTKNWYTFEQLKKNFRIIWPRAIAPATN